MVDVTCDTNELMQMMHVSSDIDDIMKIFDATCDTNDLMERVAKRYNKIYG